MNQLRTSPLGKIIALLLLFTVVTLASCRPGDSTEILKMRAPFWISSLTLVIAAITAFLYSKLFYPSRTGLTRVVLSFFVSVVVLLIGKYLGVKLLQNYSLIDTFVVSFIFSRAAEGILQLPGIKDKLKI